MPEFTFRLNPRGGELPGCSAVLNGHGMHYEVDNYRTTLSTVSVLRPLIATLAPSLAKRRAIARPMPLPAPVITATLP